MRLALAFLAAATALATPGGILSAQRPTRSPIPAPASVLGFAPGTDRRLVEWGTIVEYFRTLDAASPRLQVRQLGRSTGDLPFIVALISSPANLARLERIRDAQRRLADPRLTPDPAEAAQLARSFPAVVLITSSVHSTEVGGFFAPMEIAHRLVGGRGPEVRAILDSTLLLLVPSLNPDGVNIVARWYAQTLGTAAEGSGPPELYHHYAGHDNNRDWYAFTQAETRLVVDSLYGIWHPQVTMDIHQQGPAGSRMFVPPYLDPIEPNVDPQLVQGVNALGTSIAWRLTADGLTGVSVHASYDAWTPARAFQHYHAAVRILTETASALLATPITLPFDSLRSGGTFDARARSWNFAAPWPGGRWTLSDIVRYQTAGALAMLDHVARHRGEWVRTSRGVVERAVRGWPEWPYAWVVPATGQDPAALATMLEILRRAQVDVVVSTAPFAIGRERFPAGTHVIVMRQPYAAFVQALFQRQMYPDLREYPGGPPLQPYDATAHNLPLLLGVRAVAAADSLAVPLSGPVTSAAPAYRAPGLSVDARPPRGAVRLAVYRSYTASMDEGWTRWVLDAWRVPFESLADSTVRAGDLASRYDAIVIPDLSARAIIEGLSARRYPPRLSGGIGPAGVAALRRFVENGGTLITLNDASDFAIDALDLPVTNAASGLSPRDLYVPGSLLRINLESGHPLAEGMPSATAAWVESGLAFEPRDPARVRVVARYPAQPADIPLSGWLIGAQHLAGRAAMVEARLGEGRVVLFGFRPQYRGQSHATLPLFFNAVRSASR